MSKDLAKQITKLKKNFQLLAEREFNDYCPIYTFFSLQIAERPELLKKLSGYTSEGILPVLFFASVQYELFFHPEDPLHAFYLVPAHEMSTLLTDTSQKAKIWDTFVHFITKYWDNIIARFSTHRIQTNEVGRVRALAPALTWCANHISVDTFSLIEIGTSAGLNLQAPSFHFSYTNGNTFGPVDSPVQLETQLRGNLTPPHMTKYPIDDHPVGIDISPKDMNKREDRYWLQACIWPGQPKRLEQFLGAVNLAKASPNVVHHGNAVALLPRVMQDIHPDRIPCIVSTWTMAYLDDTEKIALQKTLSSDSMKRPIVCITAEHQQKVPWAQEKIVEVLQQSTSFETNFEKKQTMLCATFWIDGVESVYPLAIMQAHGDWIHWLIEG